MADNNKDIIEALANNEEAIGKLYREYAFRFPDHEDFFNGLAAEEMNHAAWIRNVDSNLNKGRFKIEAIKSFTRYVNTELAKAQGLSLRQALSLTRYIEEALIERRYFEIFKEDDPKLKSVLTRLEKSTEDHLERVRAAIEKLQ